MHLYVSELIKPEKLFPILNEYKLNLEVTRFSMADYIDNKELYIKEFSEELNKFKFDNDISFHGPFYDLVPGSCDSNIRKVTMERFNKSYNIGKLFNSKHIVYHTGFIPKMHYPEYWLGKSIEFWKEFTKDKSDDMEILLENVLEDDFTCMARIIEEVNHPNFSICLDIGHVNACSEKDIEYWIKGLNKKIKHVHLHNNDGTFDNHYGLQKGNINVLNTIESIKTYCPEATFALEVFNITDVIESVNIIEKYGFL